MTSRESKTMRLTLNGIKRRGKDQCVKFWLMQGKQVRIWSGEHRLFWRPNGNGYTSKPEEAGIWDFDAAYGRTEHCGPEKRIEYREVRLVDEAVQAFIQAIQGPLEQVLQCFTRLDFSTAKSCPGLVGHHPQKRDDIP